MVRWTHLGHICQLGRSERRRRSVALDSAGRLWTRLAHLSVMRDFVADGLDRMLTTSELAEYLGVVPQAIYDLRSAGHGPRGVRIGKEMRFRVSDIRSWIDSRAETPEAVSAHAR